VAATHQSHKNDLTFDKKTGNKSARKDVLSRGGVQENMSSIHNLPNLSAPPVEDQLQETGSHSDTSHPQTTQPEQSASPFEGGDAGVSEFLKEQTPPSSPASDYSQSSASRYSQDSARNSQDLDLPNPHDYRNSLPNPHPAPGADQAFVEGRSPLATPASNSLQREIAARTARSAANSEIMARSAGAVQRNRKKNQPIENTRSTQQYTAATHPALSAGDRSEMRRLASQGEQFVSRARQERQATTEAAASSSQPSTERSGLSDADFRRMFAPDQQAPAASSSQPKEKDEERFGMSEAEYNRRFAKD
jgi:hypothetical protein